MKKLSANEIRKMWIDFFAQKNHFFIEPVSLVPKDDPSLLWINSGVATLKPYFEGRQEPPSKKIVNSQKCIRTNDIENVGVTARHQTMFEMLGNFSIGDYFKKEAIHFAWELLTSDKWFAINKDKLYITVFEDDKEAYDIWTNEIKIPKDRIFKGPRDTNFWDVGQGPCGPNSEIFYDRGIEYDPKNIGPKLLKYDIENDRYVEIWNIVFSQFNNDGKGNYSELPRKNIDTGAGLERIVSISQNAPTNFDTDLFLPTIKEVEKLSNNKFKYDTKGYFSNNDEVSSINTAFKVIADHTRTVVFAISDGAYPSNKDRGYIIRRLIRRSMVYGRKLGIGEAFLYKLVDIVTKTMSYFYPKLNDKISEVKEVILEEENKFLLTLSKGFNLINDLIETKNELSAKDCLLLFESFGFPIELINELVDDRNKNIKEAKKRIKVDNKGFKELLENVKELSRNSRKDGQAWNPLSHILENLKIKSEFVGYEKTKVKTKVTYIYKGEKELKSIKGDTANIILEQTPFFATKGGQEHDTGIIVNNDGEIFNVIDINEGKNGQHVHLVVANNEIKVGDEVEAVVDIDKRTYTMKNHSGTHLIHSSVREVLGKECNQVGSFNNEKGLRIDINYKKTPSEEEIDKIENLVIENIKKNLKRETYITDLKTAIDKYKAIALFNEKYKEKVRVIKFGDFSSELCGGTHVEKTKDIEDFMITKVESKGSGVIRFTAITSSKEIRNYLTEQFNKIIFGLKNQFDEFNKIKLSLSKLEIEKLDINLVQELIAKIDSLPISRKNLKLVNKLSDDFRYEFKKFTSRYDLLQSEKLISNFLDIKPVKNKDHNLLIITSNELSSKVLKNLSDSLQNKYDDLILHLINKEEKVYLVSVAKSLNGKYSAIDIFKSVKDYNLKGGGNPQIAQGKIA